MVEKTDRELLQELHQVVIGIPDNPHDNGLVGQIADIERQVRSTNGTVSANVIRLNVVERDVKEIKNEGHTVRFTRNQTVIGGSSLLTFLCLLLVTLGKILQWW